MTASREDVIAIARGWLGTPFHDGAQLKGVGCDCAQLLGAVYGEAGLTPGLVIEPYSPQFMLHRDDPLFETYVRRFTQEIDPADVKPADVVLYRVGRSFAHGAIVLEWPGSIIHAFKSFGAVAVTDGFEADLLGRATKFFSVW